MVGCIWSLNGEGEAAKRIEGEAGLLADPRAWKVRRVDGEKRVDRTNAASKTTVLPGCRDE